VNAELDHWSSSTNTPNPELDCGLVHEKSGSNCGSEPNVRITTNSMMMAGEVGVAAHCIAEGSVYGWPRA
jgi:hypothetical protein